MRSEGQDFRLLVGPEPFDPVDLAPESAAAGPQATVVQFTALLSGPDIARLRAAYGLRLDRFVPNLAYLERLDAATADRVRADFLVRAVTPFPQASKLAPDIPATGPLDLTAVLFDDSDAAAVTAALTTLGARDVATSDARAFGGRLRLRLSLDVTTKLAQVVAIEDITWIEPVPTIVDADVPSAQTTQSGDPVRGTIWARDLHGEGQVIQIIERGTLDLNHCFFAGTAPNKPGPGHRKVRELFNPTSAPPRDHFMKVAGIAAGDELGNSGGHQDRGGAWAAKIAGNDANLFLAPPDRNRGTRTLHDLLEDGRGVGATIHNMSWSTNLRYDIAARDVDAFCIAREEQVVVAAGENTGVHPKNASPSVAFNTICVAAAKAHPDHMSRGSGVDGPSFDGRRKPDLMAVGCGIRTSVLPPAPSTGLYCDTALQPRCSTSFAAPNVSAAAALVRQYFTQGFYPLGRPVEGNRVLSPSGALIKAVLLNATVDMTGHPGYPTDTEGWGLIQLDRTLVFDGPGTRSLITIDIPSRAGLRLAETRSYRFGVRDSAEPLKITFVWANRPPSEHVVSPTVQAIRFEVEDPAGNLYSGNDFDVPSGVSRQRKASPPVPPDITNNVQMVVLPSPVVGPWTIRLRPYLNLETQGYALVISGGVT
ncbi:S8 family serine peptidase [Nonomuraea guangzhouensis]|uniref:S8 family serine peptidase n=1 Tax=Nonomuraea guangzhouensis TaxID=1291555 RepID=UPI001C5D0297|nr:S8 family serine peptidase [Nonomuraea guangzhouensis]